MHLPAVTHPAGAVSLAVLLVAELAVLRFLGDRISGRMLAAYMRGGASRALVYLLIAPGVAMHELAHAAATYLVGGRVVQMSLFRPVANETGGMTLGHVVPALPRGLWRSTIVSLAPLVMPLVVLYLVAPLCLETLHGVHGPSRVFSALATSLPHPLAIVWLVLFLLAVPSCFPSDQDFRALGVAGVLLVPLCVVPFLVAIARPVWAATALTPFTLLAGVLGPAAIACALLYGMLAFASGRR